MTSYPSSHPPHPQVMGQIMKNKRWRNHNSKKQMHSYLPQSPCFWANPHQEAPEYLIDCLNCLNKPPVVAYPDFSSVFILHTDASEVGLGAVLYQRQNGKPRVIAYGSSTLTPAEKNYHLHSGKLEFLALKWAVCDPFRDYLY